MSEAPWTEAMLIERLRTRYNLDLGNGPAWAFARHVANDAGFGKTRTLDAVAMSLHPSKGCALHGFEVKVTRGDWRRELADPTKAAAFTEHLDYFWVVAPPGVVPVAELPSAWGLMETSGAGLRVKHQADALRPVVSWFGGNPVRSAPVDRGFVACLLRASTRKPQLAGTP